MTLTLPRAEQNWLEEYRDALRREYPGVVRRMIVYGSKARGDANEESDIDIVIIVKNEAECLDEQMRTLGHDLAILTPALPQLFVHTESSWEDRIKRQFPFQQIVEREGIDVFQEKIGSDSTEKRKW